MDSVLVIVAALEMTFVNLYISYICSKKKYSAFVTWTILLVFSICMFVLIRLVMIDVPDFGNGNGLNILFGFLYLIPLGIIYAQPIKYTLAIMCFSWIYTMFLFSLSVRLGSMVNEQNFGLTVLISQSLFYIFTLPRFMPFLKNEFVSVVQNIDDKMLSLLLQFGLVWFITAVLINYYFVVGGTAILKFAITLLLVISVFLSFKLFYSLVVVSKTTTKLFAKIKTDPLTKLKNRVGFIEDGEQMIKDNTPFSIVFIDFDNFKIINDQHGHTVGDEYLVDFSIAIDNLFRDQGCLYRMSGDEFVFLFKGGCVDDFCDTAESKICSIWKSKVDFHGFSCGHASFPQDGNKLNKLMEKADFNMYQKKKYKHKMYLKE